MYLIMKYKVGITQSGYFEQWNGALLIIQFNRSSKENYL